MTVYLDFDDFREGNFGKEYLSELVEYFDNFKCSLFAIPALTEVKGKRFQFPKKHYEFCVHGYKHEMHEDLNDQQIATLTKSNFYQKIYRAPFWQLSDELYDRLKAAGWQVMLNSEVDDPRDGIKFNWNLKNEPDLTKEVLIGHGHISNVCGNGIQESVDRIKMLPKDTEFKFLSEYK